MITANEARQLSAKHSKRMKRIYDDIEQAAKSGLKETTFNTGDASKEELGILTQNGFVCSYETAEVDGGQFIVVKW